MPKRNKCLCPIVDSQPTDAVGLQTQASPAWGWLGIPRVRRFENAGTGGQVRLAKLGLDKRCHEAWGLAFWRTVTCHFGTGAGKVKGMLIPTGAGNVEQGMPMPTDALVTQERRGAASAHCILSRLSRFRDRQSQVDVSKLSVSSYTIYDRAACAILNPIRGRTFFTRLQPCVGGWAAGPNDAKFPAKTLYIRRT